MGLWSLHLAASPAHNTQMVRLEVFADITCPFTHVGLKRVVEELDSADRDVQIIVRAWPLEWVNGAPLDADAVGTKAEALRQQLGTTWFAGFRTDVWPASTIPALNLAAEAYALDHQTGLAVSVALRDALFEEGHNVDDATVLHRIASQYGLNPPSENVDDRVLADYEEGQRRGVKGSPDFWLGEEEFFCPALKLGHDDAGLTAEFDTVGFSQFIDRVRTTSR